MLEQKGESVQNYLTVRFNKNPEDFLAYLTGRSNQVVKDRDGKTPVKRSVEQTVKLPWTCNDNINAMIAFLEKLQHRAQVEEIPQMAIMLQNRIEHFSRMLIDK